MTQSSLTSTSEARVTRVSELAESVRRVGDWELVRLAATGSLAEIYQARPAGGPEDRPAAYAVKLLRPEWQDDPRAVALLRREAMVSRTVCHPHLVSILATGLSQSPHYLVMPWLEGVTLDARLIAKPRLELPRILWIARQVAEALEALAAANWMHGDVKPANIHLSPEGHVTLLDLGFARHREETDSVVNRCVMGSCAYLAPEMLTSALRPDIRSDLYSLGVVLFEMLTGQLPFKARDMVELVAQHKQSQAPDLRELVPYLPMGIVRLVRELLAKDQLRRPQTPRELIDQLIPLEIATFAERIVA